MRQFQELEKLPEEEKAVVKCFLDAFLTKKGHTPGRSRRAAAARRSVQRTSETVRRVLRPTSNRYPR